MHDAIFLHTIVVVDKVHFIHLLLVLRFQLLLSGKSTLQFFLLGQQTRL